MLKQMTLTFFDASTKMLGEVRVLRSALALTCLLGLPGCATMVTGNHQTIAIRSDPLGATCEIHQGNDLVGVVNATPGTIVVKKGRHDLGIDCTMPGYYGGAAVLQPSFQDMTYVNALLGGVGGLIGLAVDTSSGAIDGYPHGVIVLMQRQPRPGETQEETDRLAVIAANRHLMLGYSTPN